MTAALLTSLFLLALAVSLGLQLWLARRQLHHVLAHRSAVPAHFAGRITLAAHQKAADYTAARTRVTVVELLLDAVVLLALTLGGGLALIAGSVAAVPVAPLAQDVALIVFVAILGGALALPLAWYRTFVIEERFGFNRMTLRLWIADIIKGALIGAALGIPLVTLVLWLMARAGTLWWLYAWLAWVAFQVLVLAHELGHFKLKHVLKRTTWFAAGSLALLALLGWLVGEPWFYAGLGVPGPAPRYGVALVLFMLALPAFTFLASPLAALYSRRHEFEADRYAARNASAPALVTALVKLYEDNASTLTPDPLHSAFFDSHPPAPARIARLERAGA